MARTTWDGLDVDEQIDIRRRTYRALQRQGQCSASTLNSSLELEIQLTTGALAALLRDGVVEYVQCQGTGAWLWRAKR